MKQQKIWEKTLFDPDVNYVEVKVQQIFQKNIYFIRIQALDPLIKIKIFRYLFSYLIVRVIGFTMQLY